jgi:excisionase family DNA binding protein
MAKDASDRLVTIRDVAAYMGCTVRHVQNLMACGLPHLKLGRLLRFRLDEIDAYLSEKRRINLRD